MAFTIDRSSGSDIVITGGSVDTANNNSNTTIYDEAGASIVALNVKGYQYVKATPSSVWSGQGNGTASDTLVGGDGNDLVVWDSNTTSGLAFSGGSTHERLYDSGDGANRDFEIFDLRAGNDILNLTYENSGFFATNEYSGAATVYGGAGNDVIATSFGADRIWGDAGTGTASVTPGSDTIYAGDGNDIVFGDNGSTNVNETIGAADTIFGGLGNDTMYGEGGDDFISQAQGTDTAYGGGGNDTIDASGGLDNWGYGGDGNDRLIAADKAYGGNGDDWIDGGYGGTVAGTDTLYGDAGNDTIYGYDANDTLYGGVGTDSLYGGTENDLLWSSSDATLASGGGRGVKLWDGASGSATTLAASGQSYSFDLFDGGDGLDTLALTGDSDIFVNSLGDINSGSGYGNYGTPRLTGIELILAGAGADIIGLNHFDNDGGGSDTSQVYSANITIAGEDGNDSIYSGSGNDLIVGGRLTAGGPGDGADLLFGGAGDDVIWGDHLGDLTNGGNDVIYGGEGIDTIYGGGGDDTIFDTTAVVSANATFIDGGVGSDIITAAFNNAGATATINGGLNSGGDGADSVFTSGVYSSVSSNLGLGNDIFSGSQNAGVNKDIVNGQDGNDAIAGWIGGDTLYGGNNDDVLWGGAGTDVIYGGDGDDVIYPDTGNGDVMYGGSGIDYYYLTRADGPVNEIYDLARGAGAPVTSENYLVINPVISVALDNGDNYVDGTGVWETDHIITDNNGNDMVQVTHGVGSHDWTLTVVSGVGSTGPATSVNFDDRDITEIALWNNDAGNMASPNYNNAHTIQLYKFDGTTWVFDTEY